MTTEHQMATFASVLARRTKAAFTAYDKDEITLDELRAELRELLGMACATPMAILDGEATEAAAGPVQRSASTDRARLERLAEQVYAARR